jgi:hypothetical protein
MLRCCCCCRNHCCYCCCCYHNCCRYVVTCQLYGKMLQKNTGSADRNKAEYIEKLAKDYPGLHIAYVDVEGDAHYSVLAK